MFRTAFAFAGYEVFEAGDGLDALRLLERAHNALYPIHLGVLAEQGKRFARQLERPLGHQQLAINLRQDPPLLQRRRLSDQKARRVIEVPFRLGERDGDGRSRGGASQPSKLGAVTGQAVVSCLAFGRGLEHGVNPNIDPIPSPEKSAR
jgi:hypothetical protein